MPTVVRKSFPTIMETRREIIHAISWQVRANVWCPPTDVYEMNDGFVVKVEVAGMREEDFEVAIEDNVLIISGNRPDSSERRAYYQMEIRSGKFEIAIEIPVPIKVEKAVAEYKDGFLMIHLPKASQDQTGVE
ncbi:MAG: Hsp20/alpha crystallin family protein [Anaerolineae bacterium]|nr:Hsp20/alpha crystallin family protein [Anaerolineae bacterium]MCI0611334.1 Hsp20/alpha crystallin family protein [Anaerolineae bacterium]